MSSSTGLKNASALKVFRFNPTVLAFIPQSTQIVTLNVKAPPFVPRPKLSPHAPAFTPAYSPDEDVTIHKHKSSNLNPLAAVWGPYNITNHLLTNINDDTSEWNSDNSTAFTDTMGEYHHEEAGEAVHETEDEEANDTPLPEGTYIQYGMALFEKVYEIRAETAKAAQAAIDDEEWGVCSHSHDLDQAIAADEGRSKLDRRQLYFESDLIEGDLHHFNFLEHGVTMKSFTTPAVSLTVIMTRPKADIFQPNSRLHRSCLLQRAFVWIDPVIYTGPASILHTMKGSDLQEAVTGFTHKYYSDHGWWRNDRYEEDEDRPFTDPTTPRQYNGEDTVVNGWYDNNWVPTRKSFWDSREDIVKEAKAAFGNKCDEVAKGRIERPKSRLHSVIHASDVEYESVVKFKTTESTFRTFPKSQICSDFITRLDALDKELGWSGDWSDDIDDTYEPQHRYTSQESVVKVKTTESTNTSFPKSRICSDFITRLEALDKEVGWSGDWSADIDDTHEPQAQHTPQTNVTCTNITQSVATSLQVEAQIPASSREIDTSEPHAEPTLPTTPVKSATNYSPPWLDVAPIKFALSKTRPIKALTQKAPLSSVYADPLVDLKDAPKPSQTAVPPNIRRIRNGFPRTQSGFLTRTRSGVLRVRGRQTPEERNEIEIGKIRDDIEDMMQTMSTKAHLLCPITEDEQQFGFVAGDEEQATSVKSTKHDAGTDSAATKHKPANVTSSCDQFKHAPSADIYALNEAPLTNKEFFNTQPVSIHGDRHGANHLAGGSVDEWHGTSDGTTVQQLCDSLQGAIDGYWSPDLLRSRGNAHQDAIIEPTKAVGKRVSFFPYHTLHKFERYPAEVTPKKSAHSSTAAGYEIEPETGFEIIRRPYEKKIDGDFFPQNVVNSERVKRDDAGEFSEPDSVRITVASNTKVTGEVKWESTCPHLFRWNNTKLEPPKNADGIFKPCLKRRGEEVKSTLHVHSSDDTDNALDIVEEPQSTSPASLAKSKSFTRAAQSSKSYGELVDESPVKRPSCIPRVRSDESLEINGVRTGHEFERDTADYLPTAALEPVYEKDFSSQDSIEEVAEFNPKTSLAEVVDASAIIEPLVLPTFLSIGRRPGRSKLSKLYDRVTGHTLSPNSNHEKVIGTSDAPQQSRSQRLVHKLTHRKPAASFAAPSESKGHKVKKAVMGSLRKTFGRKINVLN